MLKILCLLQVLCVMIFSAIIHNDERLLEAENLFIAQKSKCKFLREVDRCTKFFHDLIKRNYKRNTIMALLTSDGNHTSDSDEIANEIIVFYKKLLGSKLDECPVDEDVIHDGTIVLEEQWSSLTSPVLLEEIRVAIFDIANDKSPGSDGYGSYFFKYVWPIISNDLCDALMEFFMSGKLLKQWNHVVIAVIPKSTSACTWIWRKVRSLLTGPLGQYSLGPRIIEEIGCSVSIKSLFDSTKIVAKGVVRSMDPNIEVGRHMLGPNWREIQVLVVLENEESLIRPYDLLQKFGDALGGMIAWSCHLLKVEEDSY